MSDLEAHGISVALPGGWDGRIYTSSGEAMALGSHPTSDGGTGAIAHLANFPLPEGRGDFGSGAVELMASGNVLLCVLEYGRESAGSALFSATGIPRLVADDLDPWQMQRPVAGMAGVQRFFTEAGRAFCLYVVVGSHARRQELVGRVNAVLDGLRIA